MQIWRALPTKSDAWPCEPPFSFFAHVIEKYFKAATNRAPLHRICTLARQQDANLLVVECGLFRPDVIEEISALDERFGGGGEAQAVAFSFFRMPDKTRFPRLLAHAILINYRPKGRSSFTHSYVYEAVLPPPGRLPASRTFDFPKTLVLPVETFVCRVMNRTFEVRGILYCQQNDTLHVCAHSCLRMAIGSSSHSAGRISSRRINQLLKISRPVPFLDSGQIAEVINASGMKAAVRTKLKPDQYLAELASLIDSGYLALLGFSTEKRKGQPEMGHVVTVFGHSRNSNQWHAQAVRTYSGPKSAKYLPSSSWIDNFLIHDDNLGPYLSLSARSFMRNPKMQLNCVIGLLPSDTISSNHAEAIASTALLSLLQALREESDNYWLRYISGHPEDALILRSVLMKKPDYIEHLKRAKAHDSSKIDRNSLARLSSVDDTFWMVEFSLPPLYTGNRSKLGEVLIGVKKRRGEASNLQAIRLPGSVLSLTGKNTLGMEPCALTSHSEIYENVAITRWRMEA